MSQTDTSQISQLLVSWSQRSGLEVTPEQCVQAAVRLRQCQIADLSDERVAAIIGPLVCQSEASQQDFKLWWPRAVAQPVNPQPDEPPKPGPSIEEISVWKRWGWFLLLTVMALGLLILYWLPIKGYVCESLNRPAMLACPILEEPLPLGPEAGIPIPEPLCEQDCSYETPIQVPVTVGMRQPLPSFLESDLEKIQIAQEWLIGLTLLSGVLAYGYVSWLRKKLDQSNTRQQTEKEILSRVTLKGLPALYVNRLRQKDMSDLRYHAAGKARLHIRNTVRASSQRGYPSLAFKVPQRRREFILVVPRRRQGDWRGQYFSTLATELQQYDVQVTLWHYQHYPTSLFREGAGAQRASLFTLHSQYPQAMLIVAVSEFAVFNPVYQNRLAWTRHLQSVPDHLLWFDTPLTASRADSLRQAHFNVLEFSEIDGPNALFDALLHGFPEEQSGTAVQAKTAIVTPRTAQWYQLPESLEHLGDPSVAHNQPEPEDIKNLLEWLRWVLGSEAFALLCAAAVYPRPDWRLTRVLAGVLASERPTMNRLLADKPTTRWRFVKGLLGKLLFWRGRKKASVLTDNSLHNEEYLRTLTNGSLIVLRRLAQLPWLQHGFLPRWLRLALLNKLDIRQEALVADTYSILLDRTDRGQNASVHDLVIDVPVGGFRAWLGALRGRGALQDTLFASVVSRRGVFRFSRRLSRAVRWGQLRWGAKFVQAATVALAMALTGLLSWFGYGWLEPSTTDAGLDAVIARRFGQNEQVTVTIEHLVETKTLAEQVAFTLRNFQYTVVLDEVPLNASSGAATEPGNSLSVPQEHADLLKRLVQWTLYGTPVITFENSSSPIAARLQLQVPLMSRQGFSDRLVNAEDVPLPEGTVFEPREVQPVMKEPSGAGFVGGSSTSTVERPNMVTVPAGRFVMGSAPGADGASGDEFPAHEVNLSAFELGRNEVTWGEWDVCQSAGACPVLDKPEWLNTSEGDEWRRHPVVNVSKADALKYIEWLNNSVAGNYRLPSEAEWEYAARAGTDTEYSWGDEVGIGNANCNGCEVEYRAETTQVGSYQSNPWKLNDMHGNVWERTEDCWHENYVNAPEDGSAWTDNCTIESVSVLRGGSWDDTPAGLRAAYRGRFDVGAAYDDVGFRLARTFP